MRVLVVIASILAGGCARGIVHTMWTTETDEVVALPDASPTDAAPAETEPPKLEPVSCEATKTDEACFECCEAKYPNAIDIWDAALEACCPNDECSDDAYEKCATAADDLCAKDPECAGLEACEETSGCWEKVSSER